MSAEAYHRVRFTYDPGRAVVWRVLCDYLQPFISEGQGVLELGAGYGEFSRFIRASEKWSLDLNPDLMRYWAEGVHPLIQSALEPLPLAAASAGTVFASNFFEHFTIPEGERILSEARRVLKPGGRLIVVQPNFRLEPRHYFDDYTHKTIFTDAGFADFLRSIGWKIVRLEPRFMPFSMKSRLPRAAWLVRLYLSLPWRPMAGQFLAIAELE